MPSHKPLQQQIDEIKKQNEQIISALKHAGLLEAPTQKSIVRTARVDIAEKPSVPPAVVTEPPPSIQRESAKPRESNIEVNIGVRWFSWIGVVTLVIGIGFFIKYAIDNNLVSHLVRILIGAGFGVLLAAVGAYTSRLEKYRHWGQALIGGGLAIVYFVTYASYHLVEYRNAVGMTQPLVITLLSLVAFATLFFSLKDDSQVIAGEAFFLGFVTAVVIGDIQVLTLVYSLLLAFALIVVVAYKRWPVIGIGGMAGSYSLYLVWSANTTQSFGVAFTFLVIYFLAYTIQTFLLARNNPSQIQQISNVILMVINAEFFAVLSFELIRRLQPEYDALLFAGLSLFYFAFSFIARSLRDSKLSIASFALAVSFLAFAILFHFEGAWITVLWSALAAVLMLLWSRYRYRTLFYTASGVAVATVIKVIFYDSWMLHSFDWASSLQDSRGLAFLSLAFGSVLILYLLHTKSTRSQEETIALHSSAWIGVASMVLIAQLEFAYYPHLTSLVWAAVALLLLHLYFNKGYAELQYQGIALSSILALKILLTDSFLVKMSLGVNWRVFAYLAGILLFYGMSFYLNSLRQRLQKIDAYLIEAFSVAGTLLLSFLTLLELKEYWISIAWGAVGLILLLMGFAQRRRYLRYQGLILFGFTVVKAFLYDTRELPVIYRTISFIALGGVFIATSFIYSKFKDKIKEIL
ncbi:DUF2339 domain-containing protein [Candidatus Uhrbacteria bacterium]|nr:DUF2339 domain-containing protein [Candidatus Uhrbacteria bacterium]